VGRKARRHRAQPPDELEILTTSPEWTGPWASIPAPEPTPEELVQEKLAPHERDLEAVLDYRKAVKLLDELGDKGWNTGPVETARYELTAAFAAHIIGLTPADESAANEGSGNS
jgi:hypothetical protein